MFKQINSLWSKHQDVLWVWLGHLEPFFAVHQFLHREFQQLCPANQCQASGWSLGVYWLFLESVPPPFLLTLPSIWEDFRSEFFQRQSLVARSELLCVTGVNQITPVYATRVRTTNFRFRKIHNCFFIGVCEYKCLIGNKISFKIQTNFAKIVW